MSTLLRVALPVPLQQLFDYQLPAGMTARPGCRVRVSFGSRELTGLVIQATDKSHYVPEKIKPVNAVIEHQPLLEGELLQNLQWACRYWLGAPGDVFFGALPVALRGNKAPPETHCNQWVITPEGETALSARKRRGRARKLLELLHVDSMTDTGLSEQLPQWREAARRLQTARLIECHKVARNTLHFPRTPPPALNKDQHQAIETVNTSGEGFHAFALEGVTGSGKTEVYLQLMQQTLAQSKQVLLLVPEISLTTQTIQRLQQRLGVSIGILHSGLAKKERARTWLQAQKGELDVIVGTRSAVFTPLPRGGLIVVDEEHDTSYKQQDGFRYHARDFAVMRAKALNCPILLGSATPSLETLANVEQGRYIPLQLPQRARAQKPPSVQLIDTRSAGMQHGLSPRLLKAISTSIEQAEQVLVFRNRRGYAPILMCHDCGWHAHCVRCDRPMTWHARSQQLRCHHCGKQTPHPEQCPACHQPHLKPQGHGTERLEETLQQHFPDTPLWRIDSESTRHRHAFEQLLDHLNQQQAGIIVGTQILAKGHDLDNLTLVALTCVDEGLFSLDFRAAERLAQLIVQVSGRAGRAQKKGKVLLQTHHPDHPFLRELLAKGYSSVARQLLQERRSLGLPPYSYHTLLRAQAHNRQQVTQFLTKAKGLLPATKTWQAYGPIPAPMPQRAGKQHGQLLLETRQRTHMQQLLPAWHRAIAQLPQARKVRWSIDVDPVDMY